MTIVDVVLEPLAYSVFVRALIASALVGTVCAVVGTFVVLRGLAFIGDALSHAAFPGVVVGFLIGVPYHLGAIVAAVATALGIGFITHRTQLRSDTTIGVLFAATFATGVFLYSSIEGYVGDLFGFLVGSVLGIGPGDLIGLVILAGSVLIVVMALWKELLYATFDPLGAAASGLPTRALDYLLLSLIAVTVVVSLQAVGIVLVVAMLVTPAATAQLIAARFSRLMALAVLVGIASAVVGLYLSYWFDVASGATIVLVASLCFAIALALTSARRSMSSGEGRVASRSEDR